MHEQLHSIYQERLRQARMSFNLTFGLIIVSAIISFTGVVMLFSGDVSSAAATTAGGLSSGAASAYWLKLVQYTNERLNDTARVLEAEEDDS